MLQNKKFSFSQVTGWVFGLALSALLFSNPAFATNEVNAVAENMVTSVEELPGLIAALAYALGILLGVLGILKLKDHVQNPTQTPLRTGMIRLIAGGALFALPMINRAVFVTIAGGPTSVQSWDNGAMVNAISAALGNIGAFTMNFNTILNEIVTSTDQVPGLIAAAAYLLGTLLVVTGILKLKDHVENPEQTNLKEGVIRLITAGCLFAIPTIYNAMFDVVGGNGLGLQGNLASIFGGAGFIYSSYARTLCNPLGGILGGIFGGQTMGSAICSIPMSAGAFPAFLTAVSYVIGLVFGFWAIMKIKAHVQNPQQTSLWEGLSRFVAGGAFFALPIIVEVVRGTTTSMALTAFAAVPNPAGYNNGGAGGLAGWLGGLLGGAGGACGGLDGMLRCFMTDIMGPVHVALNFFAFCAGMIFIMIGISRLIKSAQDGARGPGGIGTLMTFLLGGALISYNEMIRAFTASFFGVPLTQTFATMRYTAGMTAQEILAAHSTITAILQFVIIVGLISFVRGIFIIRGVAEGNSQASIMSGLTHIAAGTLAVNLGPLLNAVQATLGFQNIGIAFT